MIHPLLTDTRMSRPLKEQIFLGVDSKEAEDKLRSNLAAAGYTSEEIDTLFAQLSKAALALIKYDEIEITRMLNELEYALRLRNAPIYQRNGKLVHTFRVNQAPDEHDDVKRPVDALGIHPMDKYQLRECISNFARFYVLGKDPDDKTKTIPVHIPVRWDVVSHTNSRAERWRFRELKGIIETPLMRPDGTIITKDGYDAATRVLLDKGGVEYPPIALTPSKEQCDEALRILREPFDEFPFVPDDESLPLGSPEALAAPSASRSVVLSAILTSLTRNLMRAAPMHCISAPVMASGKSYIADGVAIIATGRNAATLNFTGDAAEDEKRLVGVLMQGDTILSYDNVEQELCGSFLCSALTESQVQTRILGATGQKKYSSAVTIMANGNNLRLAGDISDRAVVSKIDAGMDDPGERTFTGDFHADMKAKRPKLVAAALTLLRGYIAAGGKSAVKGEMKGRFHDWNNLVRGCLLWLGEPDPFETKGFVVATDSMRESLGALLDAVAKYIGTDKAFTAGELVKFRPPPEGSTTVDREAHGDAWHALAEALSAVLPFSKTGPSAMAVSRHLQRIRDRRHGGLLMRGFYDKHDKQWGFKLQRDETLATAAATAKEHEGLFQ